MEKRPVGVGRDSEDSGRSSRLTRRIKDHPSNGEDCRVKKHQQQAMEVYALYKWFNTVESVELAERDLF